MFRFDRLAELSKIHKRSASYLCSLIPRANNYINDLKRQQRTPPIDVVETWAAALHTTPAYLMGETDDPSPETKKEPAGMADGLTEEDRELIEAFRAASPEKRQAILALLK